MNYIEGMALVWMFGITLVPIISLNTNKRGISILYFITIFILSLLSTLTFKIVLGIILGLILIALIVTLAQIPALRKRISLTDGLHLEDDETKPVTLKEIIKRII